MRFQDFKQNFHLLNDNEARATIAEYHEKRASDIARHFLVIQKPKKEKVASKKSSKKDTVAVTPEAYEMLSRLGLI